VIWGGQVTLRLPIHSSLCQDPTGVCDQILVCKFLRFLPWFFWGVACDVTMGLSIDGSHTSYLVLQFSSFTFLQVPYNCPDLFCPIIPKYTYFTE